MPSMERGARNQGRSWGSGKESGSWKEKPGTSLPGGKETKKGCFPKVLMLLLPLMTAGAYFFLRS